MATKTSRPGRTLLVFLLVIAAMFAAAAAVGDVEAQARPRPPGRHRASRSQAKASGGGAITSDKLDEAVGIISSRVNGAGVSESEVSTQGSDIIVVEIPGKVDKNLTRTHRLDRPAALPSGGAVATRPPVGPDCRHPAGTPDRRHARPRTRPSRDEPRRNRHDRAHPSPGASESRARRRARTESAAAGCRTASAPTDSERHETAPTGRPPTAPRRVRRRPPVRPPVRRTELVPPQAGGHQGPLRLGLVQPAARSRHRQSVCRRTSATARRPDRPGQIDLPDQPLLACDEDGGNRTCSAPRWSTAPTSGRPAPASRARRRRVRRRRRVQRRRCQEVRRRDRQDRRSRRGRLAGRPALAIVLDGKVLSAPTNDSADHRRPSPDHRWHGNPFTQESAASLANSLKYGALPLTFNIVNASRRGARARQQPARRGHRRRHHRPDPRDGRTASSTTAASAS